MTQKTSCHHRKHAPFKLFCFFLLQHCCSSMFYLAPATDGELAKLSLNASARRKTTLVIAQRVVLFFYDLPITIIVSHDCRLSIFVMRFRRELLDGHPVKALLTIFSIGTTLVLLTLASQIFVVGHDDLGIVVVFGCQEC